MSTDQARTGTVPEPAKSPGQFGLLQSRRYPPLFLTQFLGAFNDNAFKNTLVILITYVAADDCESATRDALATYGRGHGVSEAGIPRRILIVDKLPLLGTGKVDFRTAQNMAEESSAA